MARKDRTGNPRHRDSEAFQKKNTKKGVAGSGDVNKQAQAMVGDLFEGEDGDRIPDEKMLLLADKAFEFCMAATGIKLYPYQQAFGLRIVRSIFMEDAAEISGLFSRQGGKTETLAVVASGLMVLLPVLAEQIPDERIQKFKHGIHIGVFGPSYNIVSILCGRLQDRLWSKQMKAVMADAEIGLLSKDSKKDEKQTLSLKNGSKIEAHSTNPRVPIEGHTYHLAFLDETQDIPDWRIRKSIHPMMAQTAGSIVKIGTPIPSKCEFYEACQRNRRTDLLLKERWKQCHFEFDYKECARWSKRYAQYVKKEIERLGEESDDFRMSYRLHWILERGQFMSSEEISECGLSRTSTLKYRDGKGALHLFPRSNNVSTFDPKNSHVAGLDIGKSTDATVLTVARVFWEYPVQVGDSTFFYTHIANWLELQGDDHEAQFPQIVSFLNNYRVDVLNVDATGRGDPIYERLAAEFRDQDMEVKPFVFTQQSKDLGFKLFLQEMKHKRFTWPAGRRVTRYAKYKRFTQQMEDLEKTYRGPYMVVEAPKRAGRRLKDAHDDYPDSAMMTLMATQGSHVRRTVEVSSDNPFVGGRRSRGDDVSRRSRRPWWS